MVLYPKTKGAHRITFLVACYFFKKKYLVKPKKLCQAEILSNNSLYSSKCVHKNLILSEESE